MPTTILSLCVWHGNCVLGALEMRCASEHHYHYPTPSRLAWKQITICASKILLLTLLSANICPTMLCSCCLFIFRKICFATESKKFGLSVHTLKNLLSPWLRPCFSAQTIEYRTLIGRNIYIIASSRFATIFGRKYFFVANSLSNLICHFHPKIEEHQTFVFFTRAASDRVFLCRNDAIDGTNNKSHMHAPATSQLSDRLSIAIGSDHKARPLSFMRNCRRLSACSTPASVQFHTVMSCFSTRSMRCVADHSKTSIKSGRISAIPTLIQSEIRHRHLFAYKNEMRSLG